MPVTAVTSLSQFHELINSGKPVVFDFWATWCGPCRAISPIFEKLSDSVSNVEFYKVDVDEQSDIAQEVGIRAMPTFALYQNGNKVDEFLGAAPPKLEALIQKAATLV